MINAARKMENLVHWSNCALKRKKLFPCNENQIRYVWILSYSTRRLYFIELFNDLIKYMLDKNLNNENNIWRGAQ